MIGREVRLGSAVHTVVGVMPEGFAFPISHRVWIPFRADAAGYDRRQGPQIRVFGRLAPGATLESAQAELTTIAQRMASAFPETHERLRPRVMPYTIQLYDDMEGVEIPLMQALIVLLLVVVCVNVAILVYARTATRHGEIAVRSALGASRVRVVAQLFAEAFDARFAALQAELVRRLEAEPGVSDVILTLGPPGEEGSASVEIEGAPTSAGTSQAVREGRTGHWVGSGRVAIGFFDAFDVPLLAGRLFQRADTTVGVTAVVVNRSFVQNILRGGNALGRRVRYVGGDDEVDAVESEARAWHEIVGVVARCARTRSARSPHPANRGAERRMMRKEPSWRRWARVFRRDPAAEIDSELRHHIDSRVRDYIARGMDPETARRAAVERLGDLDRAREECTALLSAQRRAEERRMRLNVSWLDVKLGVRILAKYPGLSIVAVLGMTVAIAIAAGAFSAIHSVVDGTLPLDEGDRVIVIENHRADRPGSPDRQVLHDFVVWRDELRKVEDLGAVRYDRRNLIAAGGSTTLVQVAEMNAAAFGVARVAPMLGRPLLEEDERAGAPPVIVIAYEEWQRRFDGDPQIIGRFVRLGTTVHTVVGVMPKGFRFPATHRYWVPLRVNPLDYEQGGGPAIEVIGRLADGVSLSEAQAELTGVGQRLAAAFPETHEHLRPRILPFVDAWVGIDSPTRAAGLVAFHVLLSLLLAVVSVNVAILVYARTASRVGEIAVRNALGASRARVVTQLFVEALVLSVAAAALGLLIASVSLRRLVDPVLRDGDLPFWIDFGLSVEVVVYVAGLAVLGGAIIGVVPALRATGKGVQGGLQQLASRSSQMQLGRLWTGLIVAQVAIAVALLPAAIPIATTSLRNAGREPGYPADRFLRARLRLATSEASPAGATAENDPLLAARFRDRVEALVRRLEAEPGVAGATFATSFPGDELDGRIEVEVAGMSDVTSPSGAIGHGVRINRIDVDLFQLFKVPIVAGRGFVEADRVQGSTAVIVNRSMAARIATTGPVIGRRVRHVQPTADPEGAPGEDAPWLEIVGVVPDFPNPSGLEDDERKLYQPLSYDETFERVDLAVRVSAGPAVSFAPRFRDVSASIDPMLQLEDLQTAASFWRDEQRIVLWLAVGIAVVAGSVLLLSAAGIHAMLSFTVARRRREIGIRTALGADRRQILRGIFARASAQLGTGVAFGLLLALAADHASGGWIMSSVWARPATDPWYGHPAFIIAPAVALLMLGVGLLAALGPARRGLAVQPTEVLREE